MVFDEKQVSAAVIEIVRDIIQDWDLDLEGDIGPETMLVSQLGFSSVDIIHLVVAIEEHFNKTRLGFDQLLMHEGRYVNDLSISRVVSFVVAKFNEVTT